MVVNSEEVGERIKLGEVKRFELVSNPLFTSFRR